MDQTEGSFSEYISLPAEQIHEIPDSLPSRQAVLAEPLANIVHLFRIVAPPAFFRLAIVGAGTMGALALQTAKSLGARDILCVDVNEKRLAAMREMGAAETLLASAIDNSILSVASGFRVIFSNARWPSSRGIASVQGPRPISPAMSRNSARG
jgi:threonine dehydrogenase-like Zn-dependent dehydrogenase